MSIQPRFFGVIPARYASSRFPGKPLAMIQGVSMIQRVYQQACKADSLHHVVVATDDKRIFDHVKSFGNVVYTSPDHPSGTDRCFETSRILAQSLNLEPHDVIVNIQGDEPFIHPGQIRQICSCFQHPPTRIATLVKKIDDVQLLFNENVVKVVLSDQMQALYFSRSPVPFCRNTEQKNWLDKGTYYKHIGMYAYRCDVLGEIARLPVSRLETMESLEQLRWLEHGYSIHVQITAYEARAVDTPEDMDRLNT